MIRLDLMKTRSATSLLSLAAAAAGVTLLWLGGRGPAASVARVRQQPATSATACGPPHYCARTDRKTVTYPDTPPALVAAGASITDPAFGSRIVRVTDASMAPRGQSMETPASSEQNAWNTTSTAFYVDDAGSGYHVFNFDPKGMTSEPNGDRLAGWHSEPDFSYSQPGVLYGIDSRSGVLQQFDVNSHKFSSINDPSKCVHLAPSDRGGDISVTADDSRLMTVFGPEQDRNTLVYIYDQKQGCRWYNTETGEVGGQWGKRGAIDSPYRFGIHNARLSKSGDFVAITAGSNLGGTAIWEVTTANVMLCANAALNCGGHRALGYSHLLNSADSRHPLDFVIRPLGDLKSITHIVEPLPERPTPSNWYDYHLSWNYIRPQDNTPACFSTYRSDNPAGKGLAPRVLGPWENEIDCVETDGRASTIWRFAHTYSTARNGFWSSPRGNVSQDGRFYMFTSDWEDELGRARQQYRTDVFIVQLR